MFHIEKLHSRYQNGPKVLEVENLHIQKGKLYFLVGASGSGKSTFLETLGLMSTPIDPDAESLVLFQNNEENINLLDLWNQSDQKVSDFRMKNYSFIFQNTNLMPHYTAGENMCCTMMAEGFSFDESKSIVLQIMEKLDLPKNLFDERIQNLSGGQRQRLAFVRAFVSSFQVLFGDEPTGNLDPKTGFKLMEILKNHLYQHNKTGIIVSHDIPLAASFADEILVIQKEKKDEFGKLNNETRLIKKGNIWTHGKEEIAEHLADYFEKYFES